MTAVYTWDGLPIDPDLLLAYGYNDPVTAGGVTAPRFIAYMAAALTEAGGLLSQQAAGLVASSSSTVTIDAAVTKTFGVGTDKAFVPGMVVIAYFDAINYITGRVQSYSTATGTLVISNDARSGSGSRSSWTVAIAGRGAQGPQGVPGPAGSGSSIHAYSNGALVTTGEPRPALNVRHSIAATDDAANSRVDLMLAGDTASPGASQYYGTDGAGARGWFPFPTAGVTRETRTSNTALAAADSGKWIDFTTGGWSQTFEAAATLGAGWWCYLSNSSTGDLTLYPYNIPQIDGLASYVMYPGEVRLVQCDGSTLRSIVVRPFSREWLATGTFTRPPGYALFDVEVLGAGGGGAPGWRHSSGSNIPGAGGGGGGAYRRQIFAAAEIGASQTVTIGAGGNGSGPPTSDTVVGGNPGPTAGGNTSLGSLVTAYGGYGGYTNNAGIVNGGGGGGWAAAGAGYWGGGPGVGTNSPPWEFFGGGAGYQYTGNSVYGGGGGGVSSGSAATPGGLSLYGGGGGGAGGGITAGVAAIGGAPGGNALTGGGSVGGGNGAAGGFRQGGGGGGAHLTGPGGAGGAGGRGGGGGGGGVSRSAITGHTGGYGGAGGAGWARITGIV